MATKGADPLIQLVRTEPSHKYLGAHVTFSRSKPLISSFIMRQLDAQSVAVSLRNMRSATPVSLFDDSTVPLFRSSVERLLPKSQHPVDHAPYTLNLSGTKLAREKSIAAFTNDLDLASQVQSDVVLHPGRHKDAAAGCKLIASGIDTAFKQMQISKESKYQPRLFLETWLGKGVIGKTFEELKAIIDHTNPAVRPHLGVCFDTCHVYLAGYDITTETKFDAVMRDFDRIIGPQYLQCVHVNDSAKEAPANTDEHAVIGDGYIGLPCFRHLMNDPRFNDIPLILERGSTGVDEVPEVRVEMARLRGFERMGH